MLVITMGYGIRKLSVVLLLVVLILTSVGAVSELSESGSGIGVSDDADYTEQTVVDSVTEGVMKTAEDTLSEGDSGVPKNGKSETGDGENEENSGSEFGGGLPDTVGDESGLLNGGGDTVQFGGKSNDAQQSYSTDSVTSLVSDDKFETDGLSGDYWKTGTASKYTGSGFESNAVNPSDIESLPKVNTDENIKKESTSKDGLIRLNEPASRVPVPGDVNSVSIESGANPDEYKFKQAPNGVVIVTTQNDELTTLPKGTELRLTAEDLDPGHASKPIKIRSSNTSQSMSEDIGSVSHEVVTSNNAETPEEKATAIRNWLQKNKSYNASKTYSGSDDPVGEFITSDEGGSAKHFAGGMSRMLREEGVNSRVAVGYSDAEKTSGDEKEYSSLDQHAWTEYQSNDGTWNSIDPTPKERDEAVDEMVRGDESATKHGVPKEIINDWADEKRVVVEPDGDSSDGSEEYAGRDRTQLDNGDDGQNGDVGVKGEQLDTPSIGGSVGVDEVNPPYNIQLLSDPIPGKKTRVLVRKGNKTVSGVGVEFNDEYVGETNSNGEITARVPYEKKLTVTTTGDGGSVGGGFATENKVEYELPDNASIVSKSALLPGEDVTLVVNIGGEFVPGVDVSVGGDMIGRTDNSGEVVYSVPNGVSVGEKLNVNVQRGGFETADVVYVNTPELRVDNELLSLPLTSMRVETVVKHDGELQPVPKQKVTVVTEDGGAVGENKSVITDVNGTASLTIPFTNSVTASSELYGKTMSETITGIYKWVGGVVVAGILLVVGIGGVCVRRGITPRVVLDKMYAACFWVSEKILGAGQSVIDLYEYIREMIENFWGVIIQHGVRSKQTIVMIRNAPDRLKQTIIDGYNSVLQTVSEYIEQLKSFVNSNDSDKNSITNNDGNGLSAAKRIKQFWWIVVSSTINKRETTKTPFEISKMAIQLGINKQAVIRVRDGYREIRYGQKDPENKVDSVKSAGKQLQEDAMGGEDNNAN